MLVVSINFREVFLPVGMVFYWVIIDILRWWLDVYFQTRLIFSAVWVQLGLHVNLTY